jgi:crotonobetainyl-CoA:carnitine CoA-transferase CaiB-like acyl-CoA transferase
VKLSDTPGAVDRAAPILGQDNAAILTELGYSDAEQRALEDKGVV